MTRGSGRRVAKESYLRVGDGGEGPTGGEVVGGSGRKLTEKEAGVKGHSFE